MTSEEIREYCRHAAGSYILRWKVEEGKRYLPEVELVRWVRGGRYLTVGNNRLRFWAIMTDQHQLDVPFTYEEYVWAINPGGGDMTNDEEVAR